MHIGAPFAGLLPLLWVRFAVGRTVNQKFALIFVYSFQPERYTTFSRIQKAHTHIINLARVHHDPAQCDRVFGAQFSPLSADAEMVSPGSKLQANIGAALVGSHPSSVNAKPRDERRVGWNLFLNVLNDVDQALFARGLWRRASRSVFQAHVQRHVARPARLRYFREGPGVPRFRGLGSEAGKAC